jgi:hypothetical protein
MRVLACSQQLRIEVAGSLTFEEELELLLRGGWRDSIDRFASGDARDMH